eukprot:scaffold289030_cov31-Tisochrysis_lutea.AAC.2
MVASSAVVGKKTSTFLPSLACTSASCVMADTLCLPLDFVKVRMQLQGELASPGAPRLSVLEVVVQVVRNEGVTAFFDGLPAAQLRQATYGGLCFASYPYLRDMLNPNENSKDAPLWCRIVAGAVAGGGASALANPTDVAKVRLQADGRLRMQGLTPRYKSTAHAFTSIWRQEGPRAFYRGTIPNMQRAAVVNGFGVASRHGMPVRVLSQPTLPCSSSAPFLIAFVQVRSVQAHRAEDPRRG